MKTTLLFPIVAVRVTVCFSFLASGLALGQPQSSGSVASTNLAFPQPGTNATPWIGLGGPGLAVSTRNGTTPIIETNHFGLVQGTPPLATAEQANPLEALPEEIELQASGAVARFGPHKATFSPNANSPVGVELQVPGLPAERPLKVRLFGLCYYEPATGKSTLLAEVQDSEGELLPPNRILYREAIEGADLVYTYTSSSFEQDLVLRKQLADPRTLGFDPATVRLAVVTELLDSPEPQRVPNVIDLKAKKQELGIRNQGEESLPDEVLWFGSMRVLAGRAFTLGNSGVVVPSGKLLQTLENRHFLIEFTPYILLKAQLDALPSGTLHAKTTSPRDLEAVLAQSNPPKSKAEPASKMQLAQSPLDSHPGVVLDYIIVTSPLLNVNFAALSASKAGFAAVGQAATDYWNGYSFPYTTFVSLPRLTNSDRSISSAGMTVANAPGSWWGGFCSDPMYNDYVYNYPGCGDIIVTVTNLPPNRYNIYLYGHDGDPANNGIFELSRAGVVLGRKGTSMIGPGALSTNWQPGQQFVVFANIAVTNQPLAIDVLPNSAGYPYLNGLQIVPADALPPEPAITNLINVDFASRPSSKAGFAAAGMTASDYWNGCAPAGQSAANIPVLTNASHAATSSGLTVLNAPGAWIGFNIDPMYNNYVYPQDGGNITLLLTNLPTGSYDFYLYGHAGSYYDNTTFQLWSGGRECGVKATSTYGSAWASSNWDEGEQYVRYRDVGVEAGQPVTIVAAHDSAGYANLNGLQIVCKGPLDSDLNGLPDAWERNYFGQIGTDPNTDPDADGLSNLAEYRAGSDPLNPDTDGDGEPDSAGLETVWIKDSTPDGSYEMGDQDWWDWTDYWYDGDGWSGNEVYPYSGGYMHISDLYQDDYHQHSFNYPLLNIRANTGDALFAYVNPDSSYPPSEIMLQWYVTDESGNGCWEHRAYWGADSLDLGIDGTVSRHYMGPLPDCGNWARLEVPASAVGLDGKVIQGMAFTLFGGRAAWDRAGKLGAMAPRITLQPTNQTAVVGDDVVIRSAALGSSLAYQWYFNGSPLGGATAPSLMLPNAQTNNAGTYSVVVSNSLDSVTSSNAVLSFIPAVCTPTPAGLLSWWRAEGDAFDTAGTNNGALGGDLSFTNGKAGQAFSFNGADAEVELGNWFNLQTFSVAMWVKPSAVQGMYADILDNNHSGSPARSWVVQYNNTGLQFIWGLLATGGLSIIPFDLNPDAWQYLVLTLDTNHLAQVYLNGQVLGAATLNGPVIYDGTQDLRLGRWGGGGRYFNGLMDEIDVYSRALVSGEVQALYNARGARQSVSDADGNNLPDAWELQYFGHIGVDPNADPDGDGWTNLQEVQNGTNPTNVDQPFQVLITRP